MLDSEVFSKAERIRDVIRYIRLFKNATIVIHIEDTVIDSALFTSHIRDICYIHDMGLKVIIVPGARKRVNEILNQANIEWKIVNGCRITSEEAIPLIKMAAFDVSNKIMTSLAAEKKTAVIGNWVRARGKGIRNGLDYASSGEIDKIQTDALQTVLDNGFIPIFPCIGWSTTGKPYNISSLQLSAALSVRIKADKLFLLTQNTSLTKENFIIPPEIALSPEGCIPALSLDELPHFIELNESNQSQFMTDTLNLLRTALTTCRAGVSRVHIINGSLNGTIPCEIFSDFGSGTMIYENNYGGIRNMSLEDIPGLLNLIKPFVEKGILLPRTAQDLINKAADYIVYELDKGIRACAALHVYDGEQAEIAAVAVDESCSHIGIGPKLVHYLIEKAKQMNLKSVFVLTTQTADWFEQLGFTVSTVESLPDERRKKWTPERGSKVLRLNI